MTGEPRRIATAGLALIAVATYAFVFHPMEATLRDRYAEAESVRDALERNLALGRRVPALARERARYAARLQRFRLRDSRAATVDRFLHAAARIAAAGNVAVQTIAATTTVPLGAATAPRDPRPSVIDDVSFDLTLRGAYGDVIHAIRSLNDSGIAARMSVAALSVAGRRTGTRPQLNATLHIALLREADAVASHVLHPI